MPFATQWEIHRRAIRRVDCRAERDEHRSRSRRVLLAITIAFNAYLRALGETGLFVIFFMSITRGGGGAGRSEERWRREVGGVREGRLERAEVE